ncbi:MAG: hypothetical protein AAGG56_10100 [Pseudomonadota bacterium]
MDFAATLYALLAAGAGIAATEGVKTAAKAAVTDAYAALKARLSGAHNAKTVEMIEHAQQNEALEPIIKGELCQPEIGIDQEIRVLAQRLDEAIEALTEAEKAPYAVRIREIHAGRNLLFEGVEGVQADIATSKGDMTFKGVTSPGKP